MQRGGTAEGSPWRTAFQVQVQPHLPSALARAAPEQGTAVTCHLEWHTLLFQRKGVQAIASVLTPQGSTTQGRSGPRCQLRDHLRTTDGPLG